MSRFEEPEHGGPQDSELADRFRNTLRPSEPTIDPVTLAYEAGRATGAAERASRFWRRYSALSTAVAASLAVALAMPDPIASPVVAEQPAIAEAPAPSNEEEPPAPLRTQFATLSIDGPPGSRLTVMGVTEGAVTESSEWDRATADDPTDVELSRPAGARALLRRYLPTNRRAPPAPTNPSAPAPANEASATVQPPRVA